MINNATLNILLLFSTLLVLLVFIYIILIQKKKLRFPQIMPVTPQKVVDHISDCFVVINKRFEVIDFNKPFTDTFNGIISLKKWDNFIEVIRANQILGQNAEMIEKGIEEATSKKESINSEAHVVSGFFDMYFKIEITPILSKKNHIGTIILLKDITELKRNIEKTYNTQKQLVDRERLASLGELIGGVAHDINSPLASLQNFAKEILNLAKEYEDSIGDSQVTPDDHREIAGEIRDNTEKILNISNRIAGIVNSVRNHTRNLSGSNFSMVDLKSIIDDLRILLGHELRHNSCELIYTEDKSTTLSIDQGKLGQVMTNLITNAIQSYDGEPGTVEIDVLNSNDEIYITVKDMGKGIDPEIRDRIFKEILSTKGTKGTGMGLYISYMIVTGHFGGKMWLDSETEKGTTIHLVIPRYNPNNLKMAQQ